MCHGTTKWLGRSQKKTQRKAFSHKRCCKKRALFHKQRALIHKQRAIFHIKRAIFDKTLPCFPWTTKKKKAEPKGWRTDIVIVVIIVVWESVSAMAWTWLRQWAEPCRGNSNGPCRQSRSRTLRCFRICGSLAGNIAQLAGIVFVFVAGLASFLAENIPCERSR